MTAIEPEHASQIPPICAIGASAGGVKALQSLFSELTPDLGLAYVVVVHLSPDHPSQLTEILASRTAMPVLQVDDRPELKRNCVYVIAPDRELVIEGDHLSSRPLSVPRSRRAPIDLFFRSVAKNCADGFAVVLSGAGSDGAIGVRAIKEAGGVIFVQDPSEAEHPLMPTSALATGMVDFVGPIAVLAKQIAQVMHSKMQLRNLRVEDAEGEYTRIITILRTRSGHDFSNYKRTTVMRRIARRMQVRKMSSLHDYAEFIDQHQEEVGDLFSDLLISVTTFFRDAAAFKAVAAKVIDPILEQVEPDETIRAWVVGCASGEEAYSLAILFLEGAEQRKIRPQVQIFASDIDDEALAIAREGRFSKSIEGEVSEERLRKYFVEEGDYYRVRKEVRDLVLFSSHSALKDPPFIRLDLISCRNVMIYLERNLQRRLCEIFHYALKQGGHLFLGTAEAADFPDLFAPVDRDSRIYVAKPSLGRQLPSLPSAPMPKDGVYNLRDQQPSVPLPPAVSRVHALALEEGSPPSALVGANNRVIHLSASAGRFIMPSEGPITTDLTQLLRPELRVDLKLALHRAFERQEPTLTVPILVRFNGTQHRVIIHVRPVVAAERSEQQALVFFLDGGAAPTEEAGAMAGQESASEVRRLNEALTIAREQLVESRSDWEDTTHELRIANEELQSINEEYRSTTEELETSKEELQSINEELQTVNAELKSKLESISSAHNDLQNLMSTTEIGTLFLDAQMRIKLFTPAIATYFNITETDVGRAISDFTHRLQHERVEEEAANVLRTLAPFETEVTTKDGHWLMLRIRPYRTTEDRIEGVVLTLVDVTGRRMAEDQLRKSEARYRWLFETMAEGLLLAEVVLDAAHVPVDLLLVDANPAAKHLLGTDLKGRRLRDAVKDAKADWWQAAWRVVQSGRLERLSLSVAGQPIALHVSTLAQPDGPPGVTILLENAEERKT